jgi:peptidoglycan/xylan/chitin deacetylase (PgdA/CDA1 family)
MYTVEGGPKVVALTIDDGPSPVYTPQILRVLRRYGIIASFSMIGRNAAAFPGVAREVAAAGHMIVNHTWNHYNLGYMPAVAVGDEIAQATDAIHAATGERPGMFRAPYGVWPVPGVISRFTVASLAGAGSARPSRLGRPSRAGVWAWCGAARRRHAAGLAVPRSWKLGSGRAGPVSTASRRAGRRPGRAGGRTRLTLTPTAAPCLSPQVRNRPNLAPDRQ